MAEEIIYGQDQQVKIAIMKDIHEGRNPFLILSRALDYIAEKSGEPTFSEVAKDNIRSIYGIGLLETPLLQEELQEICARSKQLEAAHESETSEEHKKRIEYAILAHQKRAAQLQEMLKKE